jgi:tetratricopeptide (TPR) repeat protein
MGKKPSQAPGGDKLSLVESFASVRGSSVPLWFPAALLVVLIATPASAELSRLGAEGLVGLLGSLMLIVLGLIAFWADLPLPALGWKPEAGESPVAAWLGWVARFAVGLSVVAVPLAGSVWVLDTYDLPKQSTSTVLRVVMLIAWCAARVAGRRPPVWVARFTAGSALFFLVAAVMSVPRAINPLVAMVEVGRIALGVATLLVVHDLCRDAEFARRLLGLATLTALGVCGISVIQSLNYDVAGFPQVIAPAACFGNKNMATEYLVLLYPIPLVMVLWGQQLLSVLAGAAGAVLLTYVLGVSHTRADWLAAVAVIAVVGIVWAKQLLDALFPKSSPGEVHFARRQMTQYVAAAAALTVPFFVLWVFISRPWAKACAMLSMALVARAFWVFCGALPMRDQGEESVLLQGRLMARAIVMGAAIVLGMIVFLNIGLLTKMFGKSMGGVSHLAEIGTTTALDSKRHSTVWRVAAWGNTAHMIKENPIFGVGAANWQFLYPLYHRKYMVDEAFDTRTQATTLHNDFLQYWAELGLPGFFGFILLFVGLAFCVRAALKDPGGTWGPLATAGAAGAFACATDAMFSFPFKLAAPTLLFWVLFAVAHRAALEIEGIPDDEKPGPDEASDLKRRTPALLMAAALGGVMLAGWAVADWKASVAMRRAYVLSNENKWVESIPDFVQSCDDMPYVYNPFLLLGRAYYTTGQMLLGVAANTLAAKYHPYHCNIYYNLANCWRDLGRLDKAIEAFDRSSELYPGNVDAWIGAGHLLKATRQYEAAVVRYQKAAEHTPNHQETYLQLATLLTQLGRPQEAVDLLKKALEVNNRFYKVHQALGNVYQAINKPDEAIASYEAALQLDPGFIDALNNLAGTLWKKGDGPRALAAFERAIALQPQFAPPYFGIADIYFRTGRPNLALHSYQRFLELWPHADGHRQVATQRVAEIKQLEASKSATPTAPVTAR